MNEATKQALNQFVMKMLGAAEQGASWTADQAPLVVQEWLRWQMTEAVFWCVLALVPIGLGLRYFKWSLRMTDEHEAPVVMLTAIPIVVGALLFVPQALLALKVLVAPRVVVLEKFADLIK